jgi:hypothetical protein
MWLTAYAFRHLSAQEVVCKNIDNRMAVYESKKKFT